MIVRFIAAGLCVLTCWTALTVVLVLPSPSIIAGTVERFVYIGVFGFLILIGGASVLVMLTILEK